MEPCLSLTPVARSGILRGRVQPANASQPGLVHIKSANEPALLVKTARAVSPAHARTRHMWIRSITLLRVNMSGALLGLDGGGMQINVSPGARLGSQEVVD